MLHWLCFAVIWGRTLRTMARYFANFRFEANFAAVLKKLLQLSWDFIFGLAVRYMFMFVLIYESGFDIFKI